MKNPKKQLYRLTLLTLLISFMSFQCDRTPPAVLTIIQGNLSAPCRSTQSEYKVRLYQRSTIFLDSLAVLDSAQVQVNESYRFQFVSNRNPFLIELVASEGSDCQAFWGFATLGKKNEIDLNYINGQTRLSIGNSRELLPSSTFRVELVRQLSLNQNEFISTFELTSDRIVRDMLLSADFPLENLLLPRQSTFVARLFEVTEDGRSLLVSRVLIETEASEALSINF